MSVRSLFLSSFVQPSRGRAAVFAMATLCALPLAASASYQDLVNAFAAIRGDAVFPVQGKTFDDIEETFGPRAQPSLAGSYDWHRGIDLDGAGGENILNAYAGVFEKIDYSASAGNYVVIKHTLPSAVTYGSNPAKQSWTTFYTYYMHLNDDSVTHVTNQGWTKGSSVSAGTVIGYLGSSGGSGGEAYAPHLHFELRFGTSNPLSNQIDGDGLTATDAWFDPHMHPMLLFDPNNVTLRGASAGSAYAQSLSLLASGTVAGAQTLLYTSSLDELALVNRFTVEVRTAGQSTVLQSHVLDFNQRIGFDASTNALLDTRDLTKPYVVPQAFGDEQTNYTTALAVPQGWLGAYGATGYEVTVTATDIWENSTSLTFAAIPEPSTYALGAGLLALGVASWRRRRTGS